ncbi:unnamed protein product [Symbiodinium microadriaticum]|nr:unnamed protein product [Symbiodinium microadriaticum]
MNRVLTSLTRRVGHMTHCLRYGSGWLRVGGNFRNRLSQEISPQRPGQFRPPAVRLAEHRLSAIRLSDAEREYKKDVERGHFLLIALIAGSAYGERGRRDLIEAGVPQWIHSAWLLILEGRTLPVCKTSLLTPGDTDAALEDLAVVGGEVARVSEGVARTMLDKHQVDTLEVASVVYASLCSTAKKGSRNIDSDVLGNALSWVISFGAYCRGSQVGLIVATRVRPMLLRLLNRLVASFDAAHEYTALRISFNAVADLHRNVHNQHGYRNMIVCLSEFTRGRVITPDGPMEYSGGKAYIDPLVPHGVEPAVGPRLVVVAYTPGFATKLSVLDVDVHTLLSLGFHVDIERGDRHDVLDYYAGYRRVCDFDPDLDVTARTLMQLQVEAALEESGTNDVPISGEAAPDTLLQTQQVSLTEVRQDLCAWKDAIVEELTALITVHQAVRLITKAELQELEASGVRVQVVPGKLVFSIKPPDRRKRARLVACGNYFPDAQQSHTGLINPASSSPPGPSSTAAKAESRSDIYASGLEAESLRLQLRWAAGSSWDAVVIDVKTTFLLAPARRRDGSKIAVAVPRLIVDAGLLLNRLFRTFQTGYEEEETLSIPILRRVQKLVGELLWLSGKTRLDISYTVCKLGQYCCKFPSSVYKDGLKTLAYLARTSHLQLRYGSFDEPLRGQELLRYARSRCTVEGWSDASFGQDDGGRSHTGILLVTAGGAVSWHSSRQTLTALSPAESEIIAAVDNMVLARALAELGARATSDYVRGYVWGESTDASHDEAIHVQHESSCVYATPATAFPRLAILVAALAIASQVVQVQGARAQDDNDDSLWALSESEVLFAVALIVAWEVAKFVALKGIKGGAAVLGWFRARSCASRSLTGSYRRSKQDSIRCSPTGVRLRGALNKSGCMEGSSLAGWMVGLSLDLPIDGSTMKRAK